MNALHGFSTDFPQRFLRSPIDTLRKFNTNSPSRSLRSAVIGATVVTAAVTMLLAGSPSAATAQIPVEETFPALGAPGDPAVEVRWNRFHNHSGLNRILRELNAAYPDLTELIDIGDSYQGREMLVLRVSNEKAGDPDSKPGMWIDGNIHGNEVQAGDTVAYTAWYLCEMSATVDHVRQLLDDRVFYLLPSVNPDGRDFWFNSPNTPHSSRTGQIPVDNDGDGRFDEDDYDDLDGDGSITRMRVKNPWGRWKADPEFPDYVMVRVAADERGEYDLLGGEGIDNDGDGEVNEDGIGGYDPNRNWAWSWQPEGIQYGARDYPFSLPESHNISRFVLSRPNIAAAQSYHNAGGMILRGPGQDVGQVHPADEALGKLISERGERILPFYDAFIVWSDLYTVWGGEFEWFYGGRGMISFTNELWTNDNMFKEEVPRGPKGNKARAWFIRHLLQNEGLTKWKEFEHPDYGTIEIGGMAKNFGRVPPSFLLEEELHRNMMFTLYHAESTPLLAIGEVEVESVGGNLRRVRVAVDNQGIIPTRIGHDVENRITPRNSISLDGVAVVAGGRVENPRLDLVDWQKVRPERVLVETFPGLSRTWIEFLVEGTGKAELTVTAARGGTRTQTVEIR